MRKANGDHCMAIPGILQTFEVYPKFNIHLHGRNMLLVAALLASEKRLVMGIDATGDLLNVPNSSFDGKIQHTLMTIQASECLLQQEDAGKYGNNLFHPVRVAERASPSNKTSDFSAWIIQLRKDTMTLTESYPGAGDGIDPIPSVVKMDCALQLAHGCLEGFRSNHHVGTSQLYNNVFIYILRRHDSLILDATDDCDMKRVARITYSRILAHSPCIIKQCKSHVYRAVSSYRKNKTNKPIEFRIHSEAFDQIFLLIANEMTAISSMSELIVRLSIFVALFETEYLQCPLFDLNSVVHAHHETELAETVAAKMNTVATEEIEKMLIRTDEEMDSCIQSELDNAREGKDIVFKGHIDAHRVIERMKKDINFGVTYLESINRSAKKGKVKICLVYYCYKREADNTVRVSPRKYGSFSVDVDLPHSCCMLRNPLYSPTAARYLLSEWMSRSALWSQQPISVAEKAMDARIFNNNQSLEGTFCCEKHGVSTVAEDFGDISSMVHRRYNDSIEEGRLFAMQIKKSEALLVSRRSKRNRKGQVKKDDDSDMVWKGTPRSVRGTLDRWKDMMHRALRIARDNGEVEYKDDVRISQYRVMRKFADETDCSFMSETTFKKWVAGERIAPLDNEDMVRFGLDRNDDGVNVFRSGTIEADTVSMKSNDVKRAFLHFLVHEQRCRAYLSTDAGRDVGGNVFRYDLLFNQAQASCDQYSDADGKVVLDDSGNPLRVPFLKRTTEILRFMPDDLKEELTSVLSAMDRLTGEVYPGAFPDDRRRRLVYDYFVRDYLGDDVTMNFEYLGFIARQVTDNDRLAMHLDTKNDWRNGYSCCTTYSFVIDGYRVTIVAANKQDFGSLMDRLDKVQVEGGQFLRQVSEDPM